ncbi:hypothetical protein [Pedobacter sp. SYSU D00535]|uniref:hypothetical protein n=1 Tax=Pedobacter sp. SYSU D00535 TaxID=2810308 RepID=UPI001A978BAF|nr:hypothetical protein [Pedobacter sp. SYSU D00535]
MNRDSKRLAGIILLTVPTIAYGGYFLLSVLSGNHDEFALTDFQKAMFRAGHAHAGVLVIFSLVAVLYLEQAIMNSTLRKLTGFSFPASAILISGGFFASASGAQLTKPNQFIIILYLGVVCLVFGVISLGIGLLRKDPHSITKP